MKGERPVAVAEEQREDGRPEPHDDGATDRGGFQRRRVGDQRQHADDGQHQDHAAADSQMPGVGQSVRWLLLSSVSLVLMPTSYPVTEPTLTAIELTARGQRLEHA